MADQVFGRVVQWDIGIDNIREPVRLAVGFARGFVGESEWRRRWDTANTTAIATLKRFLNTEQRASYEASQYFEVVGSKGNRYRISTDESASGNVRWMLKGTTGGVYCAYPWPHASDGDIPAADLFLGQALQLITDEFSYLQVANLFGGTYPPNFRAWRKQLHAERPEECTCQRCVLARRRVEYIPRPF